MQDKLSNDNGYLNDNGYMVNVENSNLYNPSIYKQPVLTNGNIPILPISSLTNDNGIV